MVSVKDLAGLPTTQFARKDVNKMIFYGEEWFIPKALQLQTGSQQFFPRRRLGRGSQGVVVEYNNEMASFALKVTYDRKDPRSTDAWLTNLTAAHRKSLKRYVIEQKPVGSFRKFGYVVMEMMDLELTGLKDRLAAPTFRFTLPTPSVQFDVLYNVCIAFRGIHEAGLSYLDIKLSNIMCNLRESFSGHLMVKDVKVIDLDGLCFSRGGGLTEAATYPPVETWPLDSATPDAFPDPSETPCTSETSAWVFGVFVLLWMCPHSVCAKVVSLLGYEHFNAAGVWAVPDEHTDPVLAQQLLERVKDLFASDAFPNMRPAEMKVLQDIFDPNGDPRLRSPDSPVVVRPGAETVVTTVMGYLQRIKRSSLLQRAWFSLRSSTD